MLDNAGTVRSDILDQLPDVVFESDRHGRLTYVSRAWSDLTGLTAIDVGAAWPDLLDASAREPSRQFLAGLSPASEIRLKLSRPDGDERWVELRARPDTTGGSGGVAGVMRDITGQVLHDFELEAVSDRFRALADAAMIGIYQADPAGRITYINPAWPAKVGMTVEEALGDGWQRAVADLAPYAADPPWVGFTQDNPHKARVATFRAAEGGIIEMQIINRAHFDPADRLTGFTGVMIDITEQQNALRALTELRERESRLALLAQHSSDAIFRLGLDGRCLYASPSCKQVLGISAKAIEGLPLLQHFHPDDEARALATFGELSDGTIDRAVIDYRSRSAIDPANYRWLEANCRLIRDEAALPSEIVASVRDVGARKALEFELQAARIAAEAAAQTKAAFLANMSHEIRTPMNAVIGFTDLLLAGELDAEQRPKVARIAESGQLTLTLLNDALEMSRIDAGGTVAAREPVAIGPLILDCVEMQRPALHGRPLELEVAIDPRIPAAIIGDSARLRQIVGNLIGNAIKFTSHGTITVKAAVVEDGWLEIEVHDTGIGIAADRQQQIFDRFAQADDTIHGRFGGTGLGLAISMGLANLMGGSIALRSVEHEGSCFTVRLPLEPASQVAPIKSANTLKVHEEICHNQRPILIAEDNPINQEVIAAMLGKLGYRFEIAGTGAAAIAKITDRAGSEYALVLMDVQMPELDGISATRRLREAGFDAAALPIIALTAHAFEADVERCLAAGMQGFLAKPIQLATLSEMLDRFLATRVHG